MDEVRSFECPQPGCDKVVIYKREQNGGALFDRPGSSRSDEEVLAGNYVYLTCENGHTHRYDL